jgi:hypothetical protein
MVERAGRAPYVREARRVHLLIEATLAAPSPARASAMARSRSAVACLYRRAVAALGDRSGA